MNQILHGSSESYPQHFHKNEFFIAHYGKHSYEWNSYGKTVKAGVSREDFVTFIESLNAKEVFSSVSPLDLDFGPIDEVTRTTTDNGEFVYQKRIFVGPNCYVSLDLGSESPIPAFISVILVEQTKALFEEIVTKFLGMIEPEPQLQGQVYMLMAQSDGYSFKVLPKLITNKFEPGNYTEEVMSGYNKVLTDIQSKSPSGRIGIFDGPPGTGKTHLLRGMLTTAKANFVFIAPSDLVSMTGAAILPALIQFTKNKESTGPVVFVIEDADECIAPRAGDNMSSISSVLNLGDGILGQILDIRMVMTTNAKRQEFDAAIVRPGRLSACVRVGKLPVEQAGDIYKRLTGKEMNYSAEKTIAEVYQDAFNSDFESPDLKTKIGFNK